MRRNSEGRWVLVYWVKALGFKLAVLTIAAGIAAWFWALAPLLTALLYIYSSDWTDADLVKHLWPYRLIQPEWVGDPPKYDYMKWSQIEALARLSVVLLGWLAGVVWLVRQHIRSRGINP